MLKRKGGSPDKVEGLKRIITKLEKEYELAPSDAKRGRELMARGSSPLLYVTQSRGTAEGREGGREGRKTRSGTARLNQASGEKAGRTCEEGKRSI